MSDVTRLLEAVERGEPQAAEELLPLVYEELRKQARQRMAAEPAGHTLQPTALVHEAFIKLTGPEETDWESRAHFFAVAAKAMRQILSNHVKSKKAAKRGGGRHRVTLFGLETPPENESLVDLMDLNNALNKLTELSPRKAQIVELRFLAGLNENETAHILNISVSTVQREWRMARAFLACELSGDSL